MPFATSRLAIASAAFVILAASSNGALAQKKYDTGATDTEIKVGNIMPYSGPASAYGVIGKTEAAYFKKINDAGGINGRKINFISYDDGYSPPKAVEQARKLVESDEVLFVFNSLGTPSNSAIHKYMNSKKVPQLFVATGATKWNDPKDFPWTMGWQPNYQSESRIYAKYLLKEKPNAKIAVLYQNDDYGKDYLKGLKDGLGAKAASMIIAEESFETTETDDRQPHRQAQIDRRRCVRQYRNAEVRGPGNQEDCRGGMEAAPHPQQRFGVGRQRHQAGRLREFAGHYFRRLSEGCFRSAVGQ
jgi:branched-chain amino acid transport system substrate-binding protein